MSDSIDDKVRRENATLTHILTAFFIIALQSLLAVPSIESAVNPFIINSGTLLFPLDLTNFSVYLFFALPIIVPILYSMLSKPKRVVSPFYVNLGTFSSIILLTAFRASTLTTFGWLPYVLLALFVTGIILLLAGFIQLLIVNWVVRLSLDDVNRTTYIINADLQTVTKILNNADFLAVYEMWRIKNKKKILYKAYRDSGESLVVALGKDMDDETKTILATVAFMEGRYGIMKSSRAEFIRDSFKDALESSLKKKNDSYTIKSTDKTSDSYSVDAYLVATEPARSKIEVAEKFFSEIPSYYRNVTFVLLGLFITLTVVAVWSNFGILDVNTYIGTTIAIFVALTVELGLGLHNERSKKENEEQESI